MPLKISYDSTLYLLTCTVDGYLTVDEYQSALQEMLISKEYPCDVTTLWDLRGMKFDNVDLEFEKKMVEVRQQFKHQRAAAKIAILYDNHLAEPLVKMYGILSKELSKNTKVFTIYDEAIYWLVYGEH